MTFDIGYMRAAARRPAIRALKERSYEVMQLFPGARTIDIGCGPGIDTVELAKRVGPRGRAVGIDHDPEMIVAANIGAIAEQVNGWTEHRVGSALDLPYGDASFDACRCERVLQHLTPAEGARAVSEALRVLRPGGKIVYVDTDWATLSIHSPDPVFERWLVWLRINGWRNGFAARGMPDLFARFGIHDVASETHVTRLGFAEIDFLLAPTAALALSMGQISSWRWMLWRTSLQQAETLGTLYASLNMVLCYGYKPNRRSGEAR